MPFIRAISETSPTSKLNVTFLRTCAIDPIRRRPQPRSTDSGVQLPQCRHLRDVGGKHPREAILAKQPGRPPSVSSGGGHNDRAWATYRAAMDGIEKTKAGNRPVSEFRVKFLRTTRCERRAGVRRRHWGARGRARGCAVPTMQPRQRDQTPCGSRSSRALLTVARIRAGNCAGDHLGTACGSQHDSSRAHIDESRRSRVMVAGNWPVRSCPLRSLQESALTVGCTRTKSGGSGRTCALSCRCTSGRPVPPAPYR